MWLFHRARERETEIEDEIADGVGMTDEELIAASTRLLHATKNNIELEDDDDSKVKAVLAKDPAYLEIKAALGRELQLSPWDTNPLDLKFGQTWRGPDDPRMKAWLRADDLLRRLGEAHLEWLFPLQPSTTRN